MTNGLHPSIVPYYDHSFWLLFHKWSIRGTSSAARMVAIPPSHGKEINGIGRRAWEKPAGRGPWIGQCVPFHGLPCCRVGDPYCSTSNVPRLPIAELSCNFEFAIMDP